MSTKVVLWTVQVLVNDAWTANSFPVMWHVCKARMNSRLCYWIYGGRRFGDHKSRRGTTLKLDSEGVFHNREEASLRSITNLVLYAKGEAANGRAEVRSVSCHGGINLSIFFLSIKPGQLYQTNIAEGTP